MALTPFDGELDAPAPGLQPFTGKLDNEQPGVIDAIKKGVGTARDYGLSIAAGAGEGVANTEAGIGTFAQAPAANTLAGVTGAAALADRGITALSNWISPGSAELSEPVQRHAQQASQFAAEERAKNADSNIVAKLGLSMQGDGRERVQAIQDFNRENNPELIRQQQAQAATEGFWGALEGIVDNPMAFTHTLARSAPDMAAGAGIAKGVASGIAAAGGSAARQIAGASTAGILSEAASSANQTREGVYQQVAAMPLDRLVASDRFNALLAQTGDPTKAREMLANELADQAPLLAGAGTAAGSMLTNKLFGGDTSARMIAGVQKTTGKDVLKNMGQESTEEAFQGVPEDLAQHGAVVQADPSAKFDLGKTIAENAAAGLAMGTGGSVMSYAHDNFGKQAGETPPPAPSLPDTGPLSRSANVAMQTGAAAEAASILGAPTEEEATAALAPKSLGAIDRVAQIDQQLQAAPPEQAAALSAEREQITAGWPRATAGAPTSFSTESGARIDGNYAVMEAFDLVTSHDEALKPNPAYPREMQPRERDRAASEMQIAGIAQRLDPARLGESGDAGTGAPIVGADGLVESGNARTIALKRVYQGNPEKAEAYRQYLQDNAARFGIAPEAIGAMNTPVLVRVRNTPVDRAEFARQANASTVAQMSSSEQAKSDAARIDVMDDLRPDDNGDFVTSRDFIRRFVSRLPATEQGGMIDAAGQLSQTGYARIRNAILAKAYGDSPVLGRMVESMDDNLRNVGRALMQAAPEIAKLRQDVSEGVLFDADITPDLLAAVEELSRIKDSGRSVSDYLAQSSMFGDAVSPEARDLLQFISDNVRRPRKIAEFIQRSTEALRAAGNPNQGTLLGEQTVPNKRDILNAAQETTTNETETYSPAAGQPGEKVGSAAGNEATGREADGQRAGPQGDRRGAQGNEGQQQGEWVAFPPETGTLGIPRAEMPQVKGTDRGALVQFLKARGIENETVENVPADDLRPTQAEFSTKKTERWGEVRDGVDRSILASSDGFILDGHHQWVAGLAAKQPVKVIRFNAPIDKLLAEVFQFPSAHRSEGATGGQEKARQDFDAALADLGAIFRQMNPGLRMLTPEEKAELMPTLVKLFESGIRVLGHNMKALIADVKKAMRAHSDEFVRKHWNKIDEKTYREAASQAIDNVQNGTAEPAAGQTLDMFAIADKAKQAKPQSDLFETMAQIAPEVFKPEAPKVVSEGGKREPINAVAKQDDADTGAAVVARPARTADAVAEVRASAGMAMGAAAIADETLLPKPAAAPPHKPPENNDRTAARAAPPKPPMVAMIDGRPYDMKRDNYVPPHINSFLGAETIAEAEGYVDKYFKNKADPAISAEDSARAEALLAPLLEKAGQVKAEYDQKIIDITKKTGAIGQMIAPLKGMKRAIPKLVVEEGFNVGGMKDMLRSTIVVSSYADAQAVLDEIAGNFKLLRDPKNRTGDTPITYGGKTINPEDPAKFGGYSDLMVNVVMPNGVIAEIQINVPEMLGAKSGPDGNAPGHKLYEAFRDAPKESPLGNEILRAMLGYYASAYAAAASRSASASAKNSASDRSYHSLSGPLAPIAGRESSEAPLSDSANQAPPGNSTKNPPSDLSANLQPSGNLSGTLIGSTSTDIVAEGYDTAYTEIDKKASEAKNEHAKPGESGPQGQESGPVPGSANPRGTGDVRDGNGGRDSQPGRVDGSGNAPREQVGQPGPDGPGAEPPGGRRDGKGNRPGRNAGIPAGRDIPVKSGKNYAFGEADLTYEGSWQVKARQNVEAVELLKTLEKDGRQATREEQAVLAKFIGWGASEIANSIFGNKLDKSLAAIKDYEDTIASFDEAGVDAFDRYNRRYYPAYITASRADQSVGYGDRVTRAQVEKARPDMAAKKWGDLRDRLKAAMTPEEWAEASRSTQYAHYTSKPIVKAMWGALERMGFKGGTILEPGAGIGVFPGLMPHGMAANSIYTGVEFDSITGGILKQLFPDERILVESFIDSMLPAGFYDVAAGNPPFNNTAILADPKYKKFAFALHDYFFAKSIDSVKPGGLVMFVTSRYTMDKLNDKARAYLAERADLVGAIRLPQTAFKKNAGTDVVTDVLFLRKKVDGETFEHAQPWAKSVPMAINGREFPVNEYFHAHPEMVLGKHSDAGKMANSPDPQYTVEAIAGDIDALFAKAAETLPADIYKAERGSAAEAAAVREIDFNPKAQKEGNYYVTDAGVLMQREGGVGMRVEKNKKDAEILKDFVSLRDALKQAHYDQLNSQPNETGWEASLADLQKAYAAFVKKHGRVNQFTETRRQVEAVDEETGEKFQDERVSRRYPLIAKLQDDPDYSLVMALEKVNDDTGEISDSPFLSGRVLGKPEKQEIKTTSDALLAVLNDTGKVDIPAIAERIGIEQQEAIDALGSLIYEDPSAGWLMADEYLSGNVKKKLRAAQEAVKSDRRYARNVEALLAAQPAPVPPSDITVSIGMNWIPAETYEQFLKEKTGVTAKVHYNERTGQWAVEASSGYYSVPATQEWGTPRRPADEILLAALTGAPIRITETQKSGGETKTVFLADATEAANQKLAQMRQAFSEWIWQDAARTDALAQLYNDKFNTIVPRKFDGAHLTLPGKSQKWTVFDHVKRGAWRIIQTGNTYLAHAVGSGKTFQMIISAMEQKRLGLIQKPMMVVPNHMLKQFAAEWVDLYPAARLMVADEKNFHTENRRRFVSRVAMSDLDGVIITHSAFKLLDLDPEFKQKLIGQELDYLRAALVEAGGEESGDKKKKSRDPKIKQIESKIEKLEQKLEAAMSDAGKDKNVRFDQLGVDMLYVDEAHEFRKLAFTTQRQVKGIDSSGSDRAFDLWMKTRWLEEKKPGRSLVMASGTPVTNTLAELFSVQRFMAPAVLEERGLDEFDAWASMFGQEHTEIEADASGKYAPVTRFSKFVNVPELTQMFREFADVLTSEHLAGLLKTRPTVKDGARKIVITPQTEQYRGYKAELAERLAESRAWRPSADEPNNPDPVIKIIGDGRLAAIDMRFIQPGSPSDPDSKLNRMIDEIVRVYKETADRQFPTKNEDGAPMEEIKGATQVVFSDLGFGGGVTENRGFNARAWFEKRLRDAGIPPKHVAFMSDHKKSADKLKLFKDVNAGRVRIVVGSSKNMGTGVNMQQRLAALHHLDTPWFPADLEQREGRIVRQGNKHGFDAMKMPVELYAYSTKGSYDAVMWQMLASKQRFIDQALSGDSSVRSIDDLSESSQFQIATAMTSDDPRAIQLAGVRAEVEKLQRLNRSHEENRGRMRSEYDWAGRTIEMNERSLPDAIKAAEKVVDLTGDNFRGKVGGETFTARKEFGEALLSAFKSFSDKLGETKTKVGEISGFDIAVAGRTGMGNGYAAALGIETPEPAILAESAASDPVGVAMRAANAVSAVARQPAKMQQTIDEAKNKRAALESRITAPFPMAEMLADKQKEAADIEAAMMADQNKLTGLAREQQLEDDWQARTGAITPLFSRGQGGWVDDRFVYESASGPWVYFRPGAKVEQSAYPGQPAKVVDVKESSNGEETLYLVEIDVRGHPEAIDENGDRVDTKQSWIRADELNRLNKPDRANDQNSGVTMSRGNAAGMAKRDLQATVDRVSRGFKNLPKVHVLASPADLSTKEPAQKSLRDFIRKAGAWEDVEGATHQGEIYLFASGLADEARAEHVLATHEVTHYGLRGAVGKGLDSALQHIWLNNAPVRKAAAAIKARNGLSSNVEAVEEVLADLTPADLAKLKGWRRVVQAVRDWLNKAGATKLAARLDAWMKAGLTEQEKADLFVADLVNAARNFARNGTPNGGVLMDGTRLADKSLAEDVEQQEKWLTAEAKMRGYADIEDLLTKNYPLFEKLATLWREKNPADSLLSRSLNRVMDIVEKAKNSGNNENETVILAPVAEWEVKQLRDKAGIEIAGYRHSLDTYAVRHAINRHGNEAVEKKAGQLPLTDSDVVSVPFVIASPDALVVGIKNPRGQDLIGYIKRLNDGTILYFEETRTGRKTLAMVSMRKYPGATDFETIKNRVVPSYARSDAGDVVILYPENRAGNTMLSRAAPSKTAAERADAIVAKSAATWRPVDAIMRGVTKATRFDKATGFLYDKAAALIDRYTPAEVKAGVVADYGVPEAVIDRRVMMQGKQRAQIRKAGTLLEKLSTLTRAESRLAYEWMNNNDPQAAAYFEAQLPPESVKVMEEIKGMIDALSQEAVDLGQLSPDAFKRNRNEYLHRSYIKHTAELTKGETQRRQRAVAVLGDQYKGRGMTDAVDMAKVQNIAPEWWGRKLQDGKADKGLVGEKFVRFERRAPVGEGVMALEQAQGPGETNPQKKGKLLEVAYWPSSEKPPAKFAAWDNAGTWEVRDTKGGKLIVWRDFTKPERMAMGEIDEARYAIAKTLHGMVHDVEVGKYLRWLSQTYAKLPGQPINGEIIEAKEMAGFGFAHVFPPGTWVQVPETKVAGTQVAKYGDLAGKFIPGPVWNDVRNVVGTRFKPLGDVYAAVLSGWKTAKTALSPAVHTNNVMANFVMADWHDVSAGHIAKALRILLGASQRDGKGALGRTGNVAARAGIADAEAAREIIARFQESGANMGSWVNAELQREQLAPLLDALDKEIGTAGQTPGAQVGAFAALQLALRLRFPSAWDAFKPTIAGRALTTEAGSLLDLYEAEDQVFRLAAWLKAKEGGASDIEAGSKARKSFLDYHINAPWIQAMRQTAFPFISFTYRAVPMLLETAARKPHKIMKLALFAGLINALGYLMSGGDEDDERALLPEEKAGRIWGMVPKLIRMPWNDKHGSPVFLDVRRYVPVGDIFDTGANHAAVPLLPFAVPGGPLAVLAEIIANKSQFTGKEITLGTDTATEKAAKVADHLYKAFAPNIVVLPGTHAFTGVANAGTGRTDAFGREQSVAQAGLSAFGVKVGSYPADVLRLNATRKAQAEMMEIDRGITNLKREFQRSGIDEAEFREKVDAQLIKKRGIAEELQKRLNGGR
jgi:N12 class adenine-specific DNA methylase